MKDISSSIIDDFARGVLNITDLSPFVATRGAVNERMSRDLLEFKRTVNRNAIYEEMSLERKISSFLMRTWVSERRSPAIIRRFYRLTSAVSSWMSCRTKWLRSSHRLDYLRFRTSISKCEGNVAAVPRPGTGTETDARAAVQSHQ